MVMGKISRDSHQGAEGWVAGHAWSVIVPVGADSREVGPYEAPNRRRAAASLQEAPAASRVHHPGLGKGSFGSATCRWLPAGTGKTDLAASRRVVTAWRTDFHRTTAHSVTAGRDRHD
jgi:hypothetical protein